MTGPYEVKTSTVVDVKVMEFKGPLPTHVKEWTSIHVQYWVMTQDDGLFAEFTPLFAYTTGQDLVEYGYINLITLGLPPHAAVPFSIHIDRHYPLRNSSPPQKNTPSAEITITSTDKKLGHSTSTTIRFLS